MKPRKIGERKFTTNASLRSAVAKPDAAYFSAEEACRREVSGSWLVDKK